MLTKTKDPSSDESFLPGRSRAEREYRFGSFHFIPVRQWLTRGGTPLRVGGRALDILAVLLERPGEIVSKRDLISRVWPLTVVEDSNLKVQLSSLRRILGDGEDGRRYVGTVNGRGYRFVAPVESAFVHRPADIALGRAAALGGAHPPPAASVEPIGRAATIATVLDVLAQRRVATIAGPVGIGKTTVAFAVADALAGPRGGRPCFVDLAGLTDPARIGAALAGALGIDADGEDGLMAALRALQRQRVLLILDSCERALDAAAALVDMVVVHAPAVSILATSCEPLRTPGECVVRLGPLATPAADTLPTASEALAFPAVRLFVERAAECMEGYRLSDADAPAVADICRRMDGIPLAIELAAIRIDALGACELAARLDERFKLLARGRRGIHVRHRSLAAALDWRFDCLSPEEQTILLGLALFPGPFGMDAALALLAGTALSAGKVVDGVANLVEKSLLVADMGGETVRYYMFSSTRVCALDRLDACGEGRQLRSRLALVPGDGAGARGQGLLVQASGGA